MWIGLQPSTSTSWFALAVSRRSTIVPAPCCAEANSGVRPSTSAVSVLASFFSSNRTTSMWSFRHAMRSGVAPSFLALSMSAPLSTSSCATSRVPLSHAVKSGVQPLSSTLFMSAPFSTSRCAIPRWPSRAAMWSGPSPSPSARLISAPLASSTSTTPAWSCEQAMCRSDCFHFPVVSFTSGGESIAAVSVPVLAAANAAFPREARSARGGALRKRYERGVTCARSAMSCCLTATTSTRGWVRRVRRFGKIVCSLEPAAWDHIGVMLAWCLWCSRDSRGDGWSVAGGIASASR